MSDLGYVIQNSTADFVLLPEIYLRLGETYLLMGAPGNAVLAFTKSRELRPEYWPPYIAWADALSKLGKKNEARAHIEEGLRLMPSSVQLMASYRRLGGDPNRFLASLPAAARVTPASSPEGSGKADTSPTKAPRRPPPAASSASG